jgi:hypothetical protein
MENELVQVEKYKADIKHTRAKLGNTLTQDVAELKRDMVAVKRKQAEHDRDIEQLKRAAGLK